MNFSAITKLVHKGVKYSKHVLVKHSADILTGFTVGGVVLTGFEVHKATLKADEFLRINGYDQANPDTQKVLKLEAAKFYIRPVVTGAATIGCAVGANYINHEKIAGLAAICTAAETALNEKDGKIKELMGEKALDKLDDEILADKGREILAKTSPNDIVDTGTGDVLCVESYWTGQVFKADPNIIWMAQNTYNERVLAEGESGLGVASGDFLDELWKNLNVFIPKTAYEDGYNATKNGIMRLECHWEGDPKKGERYLVFSPKNKPIRDFDGF